MYKPHVGQKIKKLKLIRQSLRELVNDPQVLYAEIE